MPRVGEINNDPSPVPLFTYKKPMELFESGEMVKICAPMVRYTKLQFRQLIRRYNCDLTYTPMIMCDSFTRSQRARDVEFSTNETDRPMIVQFAANNPDEFATASQFVRQYSDGVELNCGCPQRWAIQEGIGAALCDKNELVCEMVKETRRRLGYDKDFTVAIKIRLHPDIRRTVDLVRMMEAAGCSYLTVHARTRFERHEPIHLEELKLVAETANTMPIVANGDLFTLKDCEKIYETTKVKGVMVARGLLANPAMFAGHENTPIECIKDWVEICIRDGTSFDYFHKVLGQMLPKVLNKSDMRYFNTLISISSTIDYLNENVFFEL